MTNHPKKTSPRYAPAVRERVVRICASGTRAPIEDMISLVDEFRSAYGIEPICGVIKVAPSTDHAHAHRRSNPDTAPPRLERDAVLMPEFPRGFDETLSVCGVRKVWRQLKRDGFEVARCPVERLMKAMGYKAGYKVRSVAVFGGSRVRNAGMGRLVQQSALAIIDRQ